MLSNGLLAIRASGVRASHYRAGGFLTVPSLLILGTDAVLAASPATPVQLAHACLAAGFHAAIPLSWGDEIIAARVLERLQETEGPRVQCSCPFVDKRLAQHGEVIAPMLLHFVAPPVAAATYLRSAYAPAVPHITYAGGCPAGADESIDVWLSVDALMQLLADRGAPLGDQPTEFDSIIPPDRRRFYSDPGGVPCRVSMRQLNAPVELVEAHGADVVLEVAQHLLASSRTLVDASTALSCLCSGASGSVPPEAARARVREHEPPRAPSPVVDHTLRVDVDAAFPGNEVTVAAAVDRVVAAPAPAAIEASAVESESVVVTEPAVPRRRSPPGQPRLVLGATPLRRSDAGRQLPRAFVARRRTSPKGGVKAFPKTAPASAFARQRVIWIASAAAVVGLGTTLWLLFGR